MRYDDFERMVRRFTTQVPAEFREGLASIEVSPKTIPHPTRADVYTLGECIPIPVEGDVGLEGIRSRTVLYHGSFRALAQQHEGFDWQTEAWETLLHELRHHLEWRARVPDLEDFDWAAEQNFARGDGESFDPEFYLAGERVAEQVYRLDDDFFLDREVRDLLPAIPFVWHGRAYEVALPPEATLPAFLTVEGVTEPPPGELVLVLRRPPGLMDLFRRRPAPFSAVVDVRPAAR